MSGPSIKLEGLKTAAFNGSVKSLMRSIDIIYQKVAYRDIFGILTSDSL